jgi:farnesyl diphosphate synthase
MILADLIPTAQARVEECFLKNLDNQTPAPILQEAMQYGVLNGGKRIRPLLVYATGLVLGTPLDDLDAAACAVELIHSYSLIHDDLPAMDNADLRRGKPSCHKAYGEAMAILAGDALQALAFQIIAAHPSSLEATQRISQIQVLGDASGPLGMAGGQALDITIMNKDIELAKLLELYDLKTGALLRASVELGMICANLTDANVKKNLRGYAKHLGLAFQIHDDLLDIEGSTATLGKPQGIDSVNSKTTYPTICGIEKAKATIQDLTEKALADIEPMEQSGQLLRELAGYLLGRTF